MNNKIEKIRADIIEDNRKMFAGMGMTEEEIIAHCPEITLVAEKGDRIVIQESHLLSYYAYEINGDDMKCVDELSKSDIADFIEGK